MTSVEVAEKLKKFNHKPLVCDMTMVEKMEYFSLTVEKYKAYVVERPEKADVWRKVAAHFQEKVDRYQIILGPR